MHIKEKQVTLRYELADVKEPIKYYDDGTTATIIISYDELKQYTSLLDLLYYFYDWEFTIDNLTFVRYSWTQKQQAFRIFYDDEWGMYIVLVLYRPWFIPRLKRTDKVSFKIMEVYTPRISIRDIFGL